MCSNSHKRTTVGEAVQDIVKSPECNFTAHDDFSYVTNCCYILTEVACIRSISDPLSVDSNRQSQKTDSHNHEWVQYIRLQQMTIHMSLVCS